MKSNQGLSEKQRSQVTFTKEYVPSECHILTRQLENFYIILCDLFTKDAFICDTLSTLVDVFKENDMVINRSFQSNPFFSAWALNAVHFKVQSFLHACSSAHEVTDLNLALYTFDSEIQSILTQQSHLFAKPSWYQSQKRELDNGENYKGGGKHMVVSNPSLDPAIKVANGNVLHALTVDYNPTRNTAQFKGTEICNKFHLLGKCHNQCPRAITHRTLPTAVHNYYKRQVFDMMDQLERNNGRRDESNGRENQNGQGRNDNYNRNHNQFNRNNRNQSNQSNQFNLSNQSNQSNRYNRYNRNNQTGERY